MGGLEVSYLGAAGAGLLSFLSPCVLPLVPPYLCFIGGVSLDELTGQDEAAAPVTRKVFAASVAFVLGFSTVFVLMGATSSFLGQLVTEYLDVLAKIAGAVIIVLGLHFVGVFRFAMLQREARFHIESRPAGLIGAYVIGLAFAFGWTPCVGPVLAAILFVAAGDDSVLYGGSLLGAYAAGLGVPFLLAALAAGPFTGFMQRFRRHVRTVEIVLGLLLIVTGVLFLTGMMSEIAYWLLETFPTLGKVG
jgi:cytochrome c-type biogenesis protein